MLDETSEIEIYGNNITVPSLEHIVYIDNYQSDYIFLRDFPHVAEQISKNIALVDFRNMINSARISYNIISQDGQYLSPGLPLKDKRYSILFDGLIDAGIEKYLIGTDYFNNRTVLEDISAALIRNDDFCRNVDELIPENSHENTKPSFKEWLLKYQLSRAMRNFR